MNKKIAILAIGGIMMSLASCDNPSAKVSIANKFNEMTIIDDDYALKLDKTNISSSAKFKYTISDPDVATISDNGVLHFKNLGRATVNVSLEYATGIGDSFTFEVTLPHSVSITGRLVDANGTAARNVNVACNHVTAVTDITGEYTLNDIIVGNRFYVSTYNATYQDTKTLINYQHDTYIYEHSIMLNHYQPIMKAFVDYTNANNYISMNANHHWENDKQGIIFTLKSTFEDAFMKGNDFTLYVNTKEARPDGTKTFGDYVINFDKDNIKWPTSYKYDATNQKVNLANDANSFVRNNDNQLEIFLTVGDNATLDFSSEETFGFYLDCKLHASKKEGSSQIFGHLSNVDNQYSYPRVDRYGKAFQGTGNASKFHNITFNSETSTDWQFLKDANNENVLIGKVGHTFDDGYDFKVARYVGSGPDHLKDVYFLFKKTNPDQNPYFFEEVYEPNIFIDTHQNKAAGDHEYPTPGDDSKDIPTNPERPVTNEVKAFKMMTGYWLRKFTSHGPSNPFEEMKEFTDDTVYKQGVDIYCEGDFMVLKVPYAALGLDKTKPFGFTINLFYRGWKAWKNANPTGYRRIPHFENITSYIRINETSDEDIFNVIAYDNQ